MNSMYEQLMQLPLFQGVSSERITATVEKLPFHFLKYRNGEQVFALGDTCTHIKFIVSGQVKIETPFDNLRVTMHQTVSSPHVLAAESLFGRDTTYPYTAISDGACGILQLRKSDYIKMINADKVFLFNILNYLSTGSQRALSSHLSIRDGSVAERLATLVDTLSISGSQDIGFQYKQKDLCALMSTQRTTLVATLDRLSDLSILEYDSNRLTILDPQGLFNAVKEKLA